MKPFLVLFCTVGSSPVLLASHPWSPAYKSRNEFKTLFFGVIFWSHLEVLRSRIFWTLVLIEISSTSYFGFDPSSSAMAFLDLTTFANSHPDFLLSLFLQHLPITTFSFLGLGAIHESGNYSTCTWEQDGQLKMWLDGSPSLKGQKKAIASTFSVRRANARSPKVCEIFCGPQKAANFCHTGPLWHKYVDQTHVWLTILIK